MAKSTKVPDRIIKVDTGCGPLFLIVEKNRRRNRVTQLATSLGKPSVCAFSFVRSIGKMVNMLIVEKHMEPDLVIHQLLDIKCEYGKGFGQRKIRSCADGIAKALQILYGKRVAQKSYSLVTQQRKTKRKEKNHATIKPREHKMP